MVRMVCFSEKIVSLFSESGPGPFHKNPKTMNLHPEWSYQAVLYEMNVRQLTAEGTLRAATPKLAFLHDMGIDAVWLMPVYPIGEEQRKGSLGSYYSIRDYRAINPELGTMADFDAFVAEAHRLGLKVLMDWVANHTSRDARWITESPGFVVRTATMRVLRPCRTTGPIRQNSTMRTARSGRPRPRPWSSGLRNTVSTASAATWRCSYPSNSGSRRQPACGV